MTQRDPATDSKDTTTRTQAVVRGLKGGAIATVVMTAFRMPISKSLPPTANFWARYAGNGNPDEYPLPAFVLHLLYGATGGGIFGFLFAKENREDESQSGVELRDVVEGLVFAVVASLFGTRVVLRRVVKMDLERDEALTFHVGHVIYGLTLGAWVSSDG